MRLGTPLPLCKVQPSAGAGEKTDARYDWWRRRKHVARRCTRRGAIPSVRAPNPLPLPERLQYDVQCAHRVWCQATVKLALLHFVRRCMRSRNHHELRSNSREATGRPKVRSATRDARAPDVRVPVLRGSASACRAPHDRREANALPGSRQLHCRLTLRASGGNPASPLSANPSRDRCARRQRGWARPSVASRPRGRRRA